MQYHQARFLISAAKMRQLPPADGKEVAFVGRSNAGKSTALNALTQQKRLAKTSKTPGRTQLINFFDLHDGCRLVDLPGYGYAKVPLAVKENWQILINHYLENRRILCGLILLMDIRHPLTAFDQEVIHWAAKKQKPLHILLSKADKLSFSQQKKTLMQVKAAIEFSAVLSVQLFSANEKIGLDELKAKLDEWYR